MLRLLTDVLERFKPGPAVTEPDRHDAEQLATAVLLIEVVRADGEIQGPELDAVIDTLRHRFSLSPTDLDALVELARHRSEHAHDLFSFTERLNEFLDATQRVRLFESLWKVAYADGKADAHETHLLRRVADLLHIKYADAVGARLRAEAAS